MSGFTIPYDIDEEDKIFGGYLSTRQVAWLSCPIILILILLFANKGYLIIDNGHIIVKGFDLVLRIIISLIAITVGCMMAFHQKNYINYDKYCYKKIAYKLSTRVYYYRK